MEFICYNGTELIYSLITSISQGCPMGPLNNIFSLVIGINLMLVGLVAFISGIVSLAKRDESVKKLTSIAYIIAGVAAVYFGVVLSRNSFNM
jgi:divalent metal cation (Fe/Co/Zn/Cd) transporter